MNELIVTMCGLQFEKQLLGIWLLIFKLESNTFDPSQLKIVLFLLGYNKKYRGAAVPETLVHHFPEKKAQVDRGAYKDV